MNKEEICSLCGVEIKPLDRHIAAIKKNGKDEENPWLEVTCVLVRLVQVQVQSKS